MNRRLLITYLCAFACSNQSIKVLDTPIEATITDPEDGATLSAGVARTARGRVDVGDNDPAGVQAVWLVDGGEICASATVSSDGVTTCDFEPPMGRFDLALEAVDAQGELATDSVRLEGTADGDVDSDAPTAPTLVLSPDPAVTTDSLVANVSGSVSPDGSTVSYRYAWTVDGVAHAGTDDTDDTDGTDDTDDTVDAAHTARDQSWTVTVTPSASGIDGPPASATVVIRNSPPDAPTVAITPDTPSAGRDALQCVVSVDATDVDGDALSYSMSWTLDGAAFPGGEDSGVTGLATTTWPDDTIPAESLTSGEWTCTALPHDGTDAGATASATVTVEEPLPSACPDGNCALEFDGIDDYVEVPHDSSLDVAATGLTVEAWLFYSSIDTDCMTAVRKGVGSSATYAYWLHKNGAPVDSLHWSSWPAFTCTSWNAIRAGQWVHYAGVWDPSSGTVRTYVNGTEFCSVAPTSAIQQNAEPLRIGIDWDWGCPMHGVIDEVRISSVPRYSGSFTPSTTHTVDADTMALYTFDAYTGSSLGSDLTAADIDGDGIHDLVVGSQDSFSRGAVHIFLGTVRGELDSEDADTSFYGETIGGDAGRTVAGFSDVNGDGYADVATGDMSDQHAAGRGSAYIIWGGTSLSDNVLSDAEVKIRGDSSDEWFGARTVNAGDLDLDGSDDLVVTTRDEDTHTVHAYLYFGPFNATQVLGSSTDADVSMVGDGTDDHTFESAVPFDANADGVLDLIIGSPMDDNGDQGTIYIAEGIGY